MLRRKLLRKLKVKQGSISNVIKITLNKSKEDKLKKYYINKTEPYLELRKAQQKVIKRQEKEKKYTGEPV